jgi:hypothetical protein
VAVGEGAEATVAGADRAGVEAGVGRVDSGDGVGSEGRPSRK